MGTDYDTIAVQYRASKTLPFRRFIELYSFRGMLGDVSRKTILDLACGEGFYTRRVKRWGARKVIGVDISTCMIALARQAEAAQPLGLEYRVADATQLGKIGPFDLVIAAYLLNYARDKNALFAMCRTIAANLKPGGRFVGINNNPNQPPASFHTTRKYGFTKTLMGPLAEGTSITYEFLRGGRKLTIENYYLSRETHVRAFREAGFTAIRWPEIRVAPAGIRAYPKGFWDDFLKYQPIVGIEAFI